MSSVTDRITTDTVTVAQLGKLVQDGYEIRIGARFKRVQPVGEYQLFSPFGILVRPLPRSVTRRYLALADWPELGKGVIR